VRGLVAALIVVGLLVAVVAALTGLLLILALVIGLAVLNVIYLPRIATRFRLPAGWVALILIPFMILTGVVLGGVQGAVWGAGIWLVAIGLPRALGRGLVRRTRRRIETRLDVYDVRPRPAAAGESTRPTGDRGGRPLPPVDDRGRDEFGL